ncbi:hypothetical protein [Streptomyces daliensis]|uniref:Lipoprotein n=1 Tax=Streptomyces daliensis TaxID=299421 RepID=A0A8T4IS65_9ACTN|nr:hypothetical protein [Streptomyces daliensis]
MTTRRTRRTVRSTGLVALAAAAALSLTACQGSDTDASGQGKQDSSSAAHSSEDNGASNDSAAKSSEETKTEATSADREGAGPGSEKSATPDRTETLDDGSKAEIYKLGEQSYQAKIVSDGSVTATLETDGKDAGLDANGMYVMLSLDGQIYSWMGGEHTGPGTYSLEGGWKAKVSEVADGHFRAKIIGNDGSVMATLDADSKDAGLDANGVAIVLSAGGVISSHSHS